MTDTSASDDTPPERKRARRRNDDDNKVGYKNPPKEHRFKPGQSGNPSGKRKQKSTSMMVDPILKMIHEEAHRPITVREGDRTRRLPAIQAGVRNLTMRAAQGERLAMKDLIALIRAIEAAHATEKTKLFESAADYKYGMEKDIIYCIIQGIPPPNPVPHPDHIVLHPRTGDVEFTGPLDENEKAHLEGAKESYEHFTALLKDVELELAETRSKEAKKILTVKMNETRKMLKRLDKFIASLDPNWRNAG